MAATATLLREVVGLATTAALNLPGAATRAGLNTRHCMLALFGESRGASKQANEDTDYEVKVEAGALQRASMGASTWIHTSACSDHEPAPPAHMFGAPMQAMGSSII